MRLLSRGRAFSADELELLTADPPLRGVDYAAAGNRPPEPNRPVVVAEAADAYPVPRHGA